ncbi:MAG: electron transfer flavoprotein subunit alpha/FixB family protein [Deltaproteobacteria bacterium]|nr:electron transfer flavoprotein subunit alpha/FixB family protein [Deltaproteobacteria bacterium]
MSQNAVIVCTWGEDQDGLPVGAEEVLHIGRGLAADLGTDLAWLVLGALPSAAPETAGRYGVANLLQVEDAKLESPQPDALVAALAAVAGERSPRALLFHQTQASRAVAPRVAGRLGDAVVMNGVSADLSGECIVVTASAYGGDTRVVYEVSGRCPVIAFIANAVVPEPGDGAAVAAEALSVDLTGVEERVKIVEPAHFEGPRLDDAEIIVSGGRGLGSSDNYKLIEQLAAALGGLPGASRPLVDDGWVDSSQQVGLTGRITRPNLYVAIGISGASQHMAGCSAAKTLVAINRDAEAAIFQYAKYGIVGDALELLPELIRAAGAR